MKKNRVLAIIGMLLISAQVLKAQTYTAYHVVGDVKYTEAGKSKAVTNNTKLTAQSQVTIPYGGKLEMLDEKNSKRITLTAPGSGKIASMMSTTGNSAVDLSERYVAYVKKQLTNKKGLASAQRYTDFATVTREVATAEEQKKEKSFDDIFNDFAQNATEKFESFRDKCNKEYTDFVRKAWKEFKGEPAEVLPEEKEVKPEVFEPEENKTDKFLIFGKLTKKKAKEVLPEPEKTLEAIIPNAQPVEEIKEVEIPEDQKEFSKMPFNFYGLDLEVRLDETQRINLGKIDPDRIADALQYFSRRDFDNLIYDCQQLKKEYNMCDWAYLQMLRTICDQFCGPNTNEGTLLMGYLYYQSGYKVRFASSIGDSPRLYMLLGSKHSIIGKPFYTIDGIKYYYPFEDIPESVFICQASFPKEQGLSLFIPKSQKMALASTNDRAIQSERYPDLNISVNVNKNLIDFYDTYPVSYLGTNSTTKWVMYAETPLDESIKNQIYPALKKNIEGLSELEAVNHLLNLVQTGLKYEYDEKVWGHDRVFFAEESLFYPYCDCEDRSILFTRLVRDLVGLECVLIYYPGHLASAVHFNEDPKGGSYYEHNGKKFTVCDPTYIRACAGAEMPNMRGLSATLIPIK